MYESAFSSSPIEYKVRAGSKICNYKNCKDLPYDNSIIFVNGNKVDKNYVLKKNDLCTIRLCQTGISASAIGAAIVAVAKVVAVALAVYVATDMVVYLCSGKHLIDHIKGWLVSWLKSDMDGADSEQTELETIPCISGAKNQTNYNKCFPFVMGKHLYTPMYIGKPYTEIGGEDGEEQYFIAEFLLGYKDTLCKNFKLGTRDLASNSIEKMSGFIPIDGYYKESRFKPQIEILNGNQESTLYPSKVSEEQLSIQLMNVEGELPLEVVRFSERYPKKVQVEVTLQGLIGYSSSGKAEDRTVSVSLEYSTDGSRTWKPFGQFVGCNSYDPVTGVSTWTKQKNKVMRFIAERELTYEEGLNCENKVIELRILRKNVENSDGRTTDATYLSAIRTWCYDYNKSKDRGVLVSQCPMIEKDRDRTTRVAFKIKADESLNGTLNEFNCIVQSKGRKYYKGSWSSINETYLTQNPASIGLLAMQSVMRGNKAYSDSKIDYESWGEFYDFCEENKLKCNGVLTSEKKTIDLLTQILQCGKGVLIVRNNKYGVLIDKPRLNPTMILNSQNVLSANNSKDFDKLPDGYKVSFINELNDYTEDEMIVCYDGHSSSDPDLVLEQVELPFVTDPSQVWKIIRYQLACRKLRPEVWIRKVSTEGNLIELGDLVTIQDDTIVVGIGAGGEIKQIKYDESGTYITGVVTDGKFDVVDSAKTYGVKITTANGIDTPTVIKREVVINEIGTYSEFIFADPILIGTNSPNVGDILSFGEFDRISIDALCFGKKQNNDATFELTFVPYDEGVYNADKGEIPEFDSKVSAPMDYEKLDISPKSPSQEQVSEYVTTIIEGGENLDIGNPNKPSNLLAVASQDRISLSCDLEGQGLSNSLLCFVWEYRKHTDDDWTQLESQEYIFNRKTDGFPEAEDFESWEFRVRAKNTYNKYSEYEQCKVNTDSYGTWKVTKPFANTRVSDRTITLLIGNEDRAVYKEQYGEIRYKIQVARFDDYVLDSDGNIVYDDDGQPQLQFYEPNASGNPRPVRDSSGTVLEDNEDNYKTSSTEKSVNSSNTYSQVMPLRHQDGKKWIDDKGLTQEGAIDTQYYFKVVSYNTVATNNVSDSNIISAVALCTNIQDIVYANQNVKEQYIQRLSAICANIGVITQGTFGGSQNNYWALSDIDASASPTGQALRSGAFRVGGDDKYLEVVPLINPETGLVVDYEFTLNVGAFEISSEKTSLNSELVIYNPSISKFDRTRITTVGTFYEHRDLENGTWYVVAKQETGGTLAKSLYSNESLVISNSSISDRRLKGYDIGKPYLTRNSRVYHFDENDKDQYGNKGYELLLNPEHSDYYPTLKGREDSNGIDYTPAILAVAPYSEVARSLYGVFGMKFNMNLVNNSFVVDFWLKYYYAEGQVLFDIGTEQDRVQIVCVSGEPNYNVPLEDEPPYNYETKYSDRITYNHAKVGDSEIYIKHQGVSTFEIKRLELIGETLREGEWKHIAVTMDEENIYCYIGATKVTFARYSVDHSGATAIINDSEHSMILDELLIDDTASESFASFVKSSEDKICWGEVDHSDDYLILHANEDENGKPLIKTNIFNSDEFKNAVKAIIDSQE